MRDPALEERARRYAALGDPVRLAIVEDLISSDRTSLELQQRSGLASNSLAYHLDVLEHAGLITRCQSSGDRRRRYVCLAGLPFLRGAQAGGRSPGGAVRLHAQLSASPLAAALWRQLTAGSATSAGTHPATRTNRVPLPQAGERVSTWARRVHEISRMSPRSRNSS